MSVYPALSRRRSLAYEITLLREAAEGAPNGDFVRRHADSAERIFTELLSRLVAVERDLVTIPLSYYFAERDERFSLAAVMPWLLALADHGPTGDVAAPTRLRARMLHAAIEDFARSTARRFHGGHSGTTAACWSTPSVTTCASSHRGLVSASATSPTTRQTPTRAEPAACDPPIRPRGSESAAEAPRLSTLSRPQRASRAGAPRRSRPAAERKRVPRRVDTGTPRGRSLESPR